MDEYTTIKSRSKTDAGRSSYVLVVIVAVVALAVTLVAFTATMKSERSHVERIFAARAEAHAKVLRHGIGMRLDVMRPLAALFTTTGAIGRETLHGFVGRGLARLPSIQAVSWLPRVAGADRGSFERSMRARGDADFVIRERDSGGTLRAATAREEYFPVLDTAVPEFTTTPMRDDPAHSRFIIGDDISVRPGIRAAMDAARDSGKAVASPSFVDRAAGGAAPGVVVFHAVYRSGATPESVQDRRNDLAGFLVTAFDVGIMIETILKDSTNPSGLDFAILGDGWGDNRNGTGSVLYVHASRTRPEPMTAIQPEAMQNGLYWQWTLPVPGGHWTAVFKPTPTAFQRAMGWDPWRALFACLVISAVLVGSLTVSVRRANKKRALLSQLATANQVLTAEIVERQAAENKFRALVDLAPDAIVICDEKGVIVLANALVEQVFGYAPDEMIGQPIEMLMPDPVRRGHQALIDGFVAQGLPRPMGQALDLVARAKDGREFAVEISLSPIQTGAERLVSAAIRDISVRKAYEDELDHARQYAEDQARELEELNVELVGARDDAEAAIKSQSRFLAMMSHELRTPLNAVIGFSDIIRKEAFGPIGNPKYGEYMESIHRSGQHLLEVITDILDLSKIKTGNIGLDENDVDPADLIETVVRLYRDRARESRIDITVDLPDGLPHLRADGRKLKQILVSLLSNGVKFTEAGGRVTIKAWCRPQSGLVIQVIDTGIGIALEDVPKALAPFGQVDCDLNRRYQGSGLGLPLTKALVELHGGSFDLQSRLGIGTTVTIRFPAERIAEAGQPAVHALTG